MGCSGKICDSAFGEHKPTESALNGEAKLEGERPSHPRLASCCIEMIKTSAKDNLVTLVTPAGGHLGKLGFAH